MSPRTRRTLPHRVWYVLAVALLLAGRLPGLIAPSYESFQIALILTFSGALVTLVWWLALSGANWRRRVGALGLAVAVPLLIGQAYHLSMGLMWSVYYAIPLFSLGLLGWAWATRSETRTALPSLTVVLVLLASPWALLRMDGLDGDHTYRLSWRFAATGEDRLVDDDERSPPRTDSATDRAMTPVQRGVSWPGFRGPGRDGVVVGTDFDLDWGRRPPRELWRRAVGPGWSSFAVAGRCAYTLEQRSDLEVTTCYDLATGTPIWRHDETARFYEAMGGVGPRSTPLWHAQRLFVVGATGIVNAHDAISGTVVWSKDLAQLTRRQPIWGFAGSPLAHSDLVIVPASGVLLGLDATTGHERWRLEGGKHSYSSPQPVHLGEHELVMYLDGRGLSLVEPRSGRRVLESAWSGTALVQPAVAGQQMLLVSAGEGEGLRAIVVEEAAGELRPTTRWSSNRLKPNFNDFVVHEEHIYGFDGRILASSDSSTGERNWKAGRFGHGQLLLFAEQDTLLVLSERGELALVGASPDAFEERHRFQALEGKTWNHPALAGDVLLVRNAQEMAAYELRSPAASRSPADQAPGAQGEPR